ncbi:GNAT family N-acetyltransferase [Leucothrix arctica]|nr:GNAT family N-acetyltransferase [Leucothrix arctica]
MKLEKANSEQDWEKASSLLSQVVDRLNGLDRTLWAKDQVSVASVQQSYRLDELNFLIETTFVGVVFLQKSDPLFWPEMTEHDSLYIHKLAIDPVRAGEQLGQKALTAIIDQAKIRGFSWVRLDCDDRPELHRFYQNYGFEMLDIKDVGEFRVARYQLLTNTIK